MIEMQPEIDLHYSVTGLLLWTNLEYATFLVVIVDRMTKFKLSSVGKAVGGCGWAI